MESRRSTVSVASFPSLDGVVRTEAASILAVHVATVDRLIRRGVVTPARRFATAQLSREQVKHLALRTRPVQALVADPVSYWVTRRGAAGMMGVSDRQVAYLTDADRLPYVVHHTGTRLYRRAQIEVVGNARWLPWCRQPGG